jgi:tetraacyldisaccharide 4'-kinase
VKKALENYLQQQWYGGSRLHIGLFLLSGIYKSLNYCHRLFYKTGVLRQKKVSAPVIVVGNFTAGGTGKTPFVITLVKALKTLGWRPGVVTRGYGRDSSASLSVEENSTSSEVGDEPLLIFQQSQCPVRVDSNRVKAAEMLIATGCNVIIADDGLQHYRLQRDIEIEILDGERGYGNGLLVPAGPLREKPRKCDFQVISGSKNQNFDDHYCYVMQMQVDDAYLLSDISKRRPLSSFTETNIVAMAGIGNPSRFFTALKSSGITFTERAMPDHHHFIQDDFESDMLYIVTEKDAIKCRELNVSNVWVVPLTITISPELFHHINLKLKAVA